MIEDSLWCVGEKNVRVVFVCLPVCSSILTPGARAAGPIGTRKAPFDATERWKDDGANREEIGATCQRANPSKNQSARGWRPNQWTDTTHTVWAYVCNRCVSAFGGCDGDAPLARAT